MVRLTGILKYAITHRSGKATYSELAAATAQRQVTVERGLNWLVSRGKIVLIQQEGDQLFIGPGKNHKRYGGSGTIVGGSPGSAGRDCAYRAHFKRADKDTLLPENGYNSYMPFEELPTQQIGRCAFGQRT